MKGWLPLCLLLWAPAARAQIPVDVTFQGELAAGYDSNIYLETAALPQDIDGVAGMGLLLLASTDLRVGPARSHHLLLNHSADFHQYVLTGGSTESMLQHGAELTYTAAPLAGIRLSAGAGFEHVLLAQQGDAGWITAHGRLWASRELCAWARLLLGYTVEYTDFGVLSSVSRQLGHGPQLWFGLRVARGLVLEPFYALAVETGDSGQLEGTQHQTGAWLSWSLDRPPLKVRAGYQVAVADVITTTTEQNPAGKQVTVQAERSDLIHQWGGEVRLEALPWLEVFVRYESVLGFCDDDDYARHQIFAGAQVLLGWRREPPARKAQRVLELEYEDSAARAVSVVGSFNAWSPEAHRLERDDGTWRGSVKLPPGRQVYMLWVDGKTVPPPGCKTWIRDGYGGKNCVADYF